MSYRDQISIGAQRSADGVYTYGVIRVNLLRWHVWSLLDVRHFSGATGDNWLGRLLLMFAAVVHGSGLSRPP